MIGTVLVQTASPTPGFGPDAITAYAPDLARFAWFAAGVLVVVLVGWGVVEPLLSRIVRRRNRANPTIDEAVSRYVRALVVVVAVFVGAAVAGYGRFVGNSALVLAAVTLAIGVAGQRVIGSLVSGIVLVFDPEFNVGNYIEWDDGAGVITSITLRVTRVETPDGGLVTVPNTVLTDRAITRPYGHGRQRVVEHVELAYETDIETGLRELEAAAASLEAVRADPAPSAYIDRLGSDAVEVRCHYWIDDPRDRDVFGVRSAFSRAATDRLADTDVTLNPPVKRDLEGDLRVSLAGDAA